MIIQFLLAFELVDFLRVELDWQDGWITFSMPCFQPISASTFCKFSGNCRLSGKMWADIRVRITAASMYQLAAVIINVAGLERTNLTRRARAVVGVERIMLFCCSCSARSLCCRRKQIKLCSSWR